jgi:hypothetical protein
MPIRNMDHPLDGPCQDCGAMFVPWAAPNEVWNEVVGGDPDNEAPGFYCPTCFCLLADTVLGDHTVWDVRPRL